MTPTHDDGQLDSQIKELLGRAVAQTPQPPNLEQPMLTKNTSKTNDRNPWIIGGGIGLSAAAALAAILIIPGLGDTDSVQTPVDSVLPDVSTVDTVSNTTLPDTQTTLAPIEPAPTAPAAPVVEDPVVEGPEPAAPTNQFDAPARTIVLAGPDGIKTNLGGGALPTLISETPAGSAMVGPDNAMWFNAIGEAFPRRAEFDTTDEGVGLLDATTIEVPVRDGDVAVLRDVAAAEGGLTLLYESRAEPCDGRNNPAACTSQLRTYQPATETLVDHGTRMTWEGDWNGTQLADSGLIVGSSAGGVNQRIEIFNIGTDPTPTADDLGVEPDYSECNDCPDDFTVDQTGTHIGWAEGTGDAALIVIHTLATGERIEVPAAGFVSDLQISEIAIVDGRVESGLAVFTSVTFGNDQNSDRVENSTLIDLATGVVTELDTNTYPTIRSVTAEAVPQDPATPAEPADPAPTGPTTDTVEPTPPPTIDAPGTIVTFSSTNPPDIANGVFIEQNGQLVRVTDDLVQNAFADDDGNVWMHTFVDENPIKWTPATGELSEVVLDRPNGHGIDLHDVATVQGQQTVLYTTSYNSCANLNDALCTTELRTYQPATGVSSVVATRNYWEAGWWNLQLADNGLIVGTFSELVSASLDVFNISTGLTPTNESLGLESSYDECYISGCPDDYTINQTGTHIAWKNATATNQRS